MSATGRVKVVSEALAPPNGCAYPEGTTLRAVTRTTRRKNDFYETPAWVVDAILPWLPLDSAHLVLDAGSGRGVIAAAIAAKHPKLEIIGVEKQPELVAEARQLGLYAAEFVEGDFEKWEPPTGSPDVIIMNPPYSRALEFVKRAMAIVKRGGTIAALLRAGFVESKQRYDFHIKHRSDFHPLSTRPSFTGGGTDMAAYAWFVWGPECKGIWQPLPPKPKRRKHAPKTRRNAATA